MREDLHIEPEADTPEVTLDENEKTLSIAGYSMPEDAVTFYAPILDRLEKYLKQPLDEFCVDIKLAYFNTASSKQIAKILMLINQSDMRDKTTVKWYYDQFDLESIESCRRFELIPLKYEYFEFDFTVFEPPEEDPEGTYYVVEE